MQIAAATSARQSPMIAIVRPTPPRLPATEIPTMPKTIAGMMMAPSKKANHENNSAMMPRISAVTASPLVALGAP